MTSLYDFCMANPDKAYLLDEWDEKENGELGFTIYNTAAHCNKNRFWKCPYGHTFKARVGNRTIKDCNSQCPTCSGKIVTPGENDLETWCKKNNRENIIDEWSQENAFLPSQIQPFSNKIVKFVCPKCGYKWETKICWRTRKFHSKCPHCHSITKEEKLQALKQRCYESAKSCKTRGDFHDKFPSLYNKASNHKWLDEWFPITPHRKWTLERCKEVALKYQYLKDFYSNEPSCYSACRRYGYLDEMTWLKKNEGNPNGTRSIYAYVFTEYNSVYVGLAKHPIERDRSHHNEKTSAVYKFAKLNNITIPSQIILESGISDEQAGNREHFYIEKYKNEGWFILNKAKTGARSSSLGATTNGKYQSREACKNVIQKCITLKDLCDNYSTVYKNVKKYGWEDLLDTLIRRCAPDGYWDVYENCKCVVEQCVSRKDVRKRFSGAYIKILENGWDELFDTFPPKSYHSPQKWTKEAFLKEASKYKTSTELARRNGGAYNAGLRNGWLSLCNFEDHSSKGAILQYDLLGNFVREFSNVKQASEALNVGAGDIMKCCLGEYQQSHGFMWKFKKDIEDFTKPLPPYKDPSKKWTYEVCYEEAKKYLFFADFKKNSPNAYQTSYRNGWYKDYTWMKTNKKQVFQYDLNGVLVNTFESVADASRRTGNQIQLISKCCLGERKSHNGFLWSYTPLEETTP